MSRSKKPGRRDDGKLRSRKMHPYAEKPNVWKSQPYGDGVKTQKRIDECKATNRAVKKRKRQIDKKDIKRRLDEE